MIASKPAQLKAPWLEMSDGLPQHDAERVKR
jgi:hypothetical protein